MVFKRCSTDMEERFVRWRVWGAVGAARAEGPVWSSAGQTDIRGLVPQDPVCVAARCLGAGAAECAAAHSGLASLRATVVGLRGVLVAAPAASRARCGRSQGGGLPEEAGEFAGAGDRDDAGRFASVLAQVLPAAVEALLCAPGDRDHARVLAVLAAGERLADPRPAAVVVGGFDEQPARVRWAG